MIKSKWSIILYTIYKNWRIQKQSKTGLIEDTSGSTMMCMTLTESLKYINDVFEDYFKFSSLSVENFRDKRILEIGPGDSFGVALKFLSIGADQVVCIDKFYSKRKFEQSYNIYQGLRESLDDNSKKLFGEAITLDNKIKFNPKKLKYIYGKGIEDVQDLFKPGYFDFIISRAVLEHIYDIDSAFFIMNKLLKLGGYMLHKIDLRDHNMLSGSGKHLLTILTIPEFIYRLMVKDSGLPNRKQLGYYRKKMEELHYDSNIFITGILGKEKEFECMKTEIELHTDYEATSLNLINEIRQKLRPMYKNMTNEELLVSNIFLIAKKIVEN